MGSTAYGRRSGTFQALDLAMIFSAERSRTDSATRSPRFANASGAKALANPGISNDHVQCARDYSFSCLGPNHGATINFVRRLERDFSRRECISDFIVGEQLARGVSG